MCRPDTCFRNCTFLYAYSTPTTPVCANIGRLTGPLPADVRAEKDCEHQADQKFPSLDFPVKGVENV